MVPASMSLSINTIHLKLLQLSLLKFINLSVRVFQCLFQADPFDWKLDYMPMGALWCKDCS